MRSPLSLPAGLAVAILLACNTTTTVYAHTWVEQVRKVASNGSFVGAPGYIRNYGPRKDGINIDAVNSNLVPPNGRSNAFLPTDLICKSNQLKGQQTQDYPALSAAPLEQIALRYHDNGHVTLYDTNQGKPAGRGTVFVYGTAQSLDSDTYVGIHRVWNSEGTGGDRRGKLLATRPYDDGRCFQVNRGSKLREASINYPPGGGGDILCQTDVQLPADAPTSGSYTLYWVWEWPTLDASGKIVVNESYTSCLDVSMTSQPLAAAGAFAAQKPVGLAANDVAIEAQLNNPFLVDPTAAPALTSDNLPKGSPTQLTEGVAPVTMSVAPAPAASAITTPKEESPAQPAPTSPSTSAQDAPKADQPTAQPAPASPSTSAQGFQTVTVTSKQVETLYVTRGPSASAPIASPASSAQNTPPTIKTTTVMVHVTAPPPGATYLPSAIDDSALASSTAVPMNSVIESAVPKPAPFLTPDNEIQQGGAGPAMKVSCPTPERRRKRSSRIDSRLIGK